MKKILVICGLVCIISLASSSQLYAGNNLDTITTLLPDNNTEISDEAAVLMQRLDEIKAMDKSDLTSAEKKELRSEVRTIKENLASTGGGVYFSFGALIVIGILLIILL